MGWLIALRTETSSAITLKQSCLLSLISSRNLQSGAFRDFRDEILGHASGLWAGKIKNIAKRSPRQAEMESRNRNGTRATLDT